MRRKVYDPVKALITGRVAVVTGAARGIGNAIARCPAAFGADVVALDINATGVEQTIAEIRTFGRRAIALVGDVTKQADVDRLFETANQEFGRVDILVNNVGGSIQKSFLDTTEDEWFAMLDLNLVQVFRCTRAAARMMIERGVAGSVINLTTIEAHRAYPCAAPYAAAKAGLENFTRTMALELSPWAIRVNAIAPDVTLTAGVARHLQDNRAEVANTPQANIGDQLSYVPLTRWGEPEDYGGAAIFLASDLSQSITGETIHVGGGTHAASGWLRTASGHWTLGTRPMVYSGKPVSGGDQSWAHVLSETVI